MSVLLRVAYYLSAFIKFWAMVGYPGENDKAVFCKGRPSTEFINMIFKGLVLEGLYFLKANPLLRGGYPMPINVGLIYQRWS